MKKFSGEKYSTAFWAGFLSLLVILLPLLCMDKGYFIYYGDFVSQQLPFYKLANDAVRSGGLFGWNWYTDLGSSFLGSYAFYLTGSPFFWLTTVLPENWVLYAIPWLLCLKHGIASMTAYAYIRRFVQKPETAVIGGLLYTYSGFQLFNLFFNHFQDVTAFFPLMLIAMEELINRNRRGWFAATVAFMAMLNYFFFAGQVIFLILYFILRCKSEDFHVTVKKFFLLAIEAVLGVSIACVVLLPAAMAVLMNNRVSEYLFGQDIVIYSDKTKIFRIIQSFFMIPDPPARTILFQSQYAKWSSIGGYLPLFSMAGVIAFMTQKKKHWASRLILICMICACIPVLNSMFYMLNASYYARWYYMPILIMAMMTAYALDNYEIHWKQGMRICLVMLSIFGMISLLPIKEENEVKFFQFTLIPAYFYTAWGISILCWAGAYYILKLRNQKKLFFDKVFAVTVTACLACTGTMVYFGKAIGTNAENYIQTGIHGAEHLSISYENDEADYFRVDISENYDNYPMFWGLSSMRCFQSVVSPSIMDFYKSIGITRDVASRAEPEHYTLRGLFSVKYYFNHHEEKSDTEEEQKEFNMAGFSYVKTENGFDIYQNDYYIPMGFTYDKFITEQTLEGKQNAVREKLLLHALILNEEQAETYGDIITEIKDISSVSLNQQQYLKDCQLHIAEACHDFSYDAKGFSAQIELNQPKLVFFSVPYDKGWSAQVNGVPVQVENVSNGFIAVRCEKGQNQIQFSYHLTGLKAGICITVAGLLLLLLYLTACKKFLTDKANSLSYDYQTGVRASDAYIIYLKNLEHSERSITNGHKSSE